MHVPRHAKDILLKHLSRAFPDDALAALGIPGIAVERAIPTELPVLEIRHGFADVVFTLRDDSLLHLEFQSSREATLDRFLAYDTQLYCQWHRRIRTIILSTSVLSDPTALFRRQSRSQDRCFFREDRSTPAGWQFPFAAGR